MKHSNSIAFAALLCFAEVFNNVSGLGEYGQCEKLKILKASKGVIRFPLVGKYDNNLDCSWQITASAGKAIQFQVESIAIEPTPNCRRCCLRDWLSLYDGPTAHASSLMATLCGTVTPSTPFTTKSNAALVTFRSNSRNGYKGFQLRYRVISMMTRSNSDGYIEDIDGCNGETAILNDGEGELTSPNFGYGRKYPNGASCSWRIVVARPLKVLLKFVKFSLEPPSGYNECHDALSVYDGPSSSSPIFGSFCGRQALNDMISSGNQMYLEFTSDEWKTAPGFRIKYSAKEMSGSESDCGVPDVLPKTYSKIVGGVEAVPHSWPWMVQIEVFMNRNWIFWCGGAVLYSQWILTAAHCAKGLGPPSYFRLTLGDHSMRKTEGMEQIWEIDGIYIHERYDSLTNDNDIALLHLPRELEFNHYIKPICLPKTDVGEGVLCIVAGWGKRYGTGVPDVLNQVPVPTINRQQCNRPDWYSGRITHNMFCAGYAEGRKDSCQGDSGGPLACQSADGKWMMSGITSFGDGCALPKHPGVYTRVAKYLKWIKRITGI